MNLNPGGNMTHKYVWPACIAAAAHGALLFGVPKSVPPPSLPGEEPFPRHAACGMTGIMPNAGACRIAPHRSSDDNPFDAA
jgi:hypothetical protein